MYIQPIADIIRGFDVGYHIYADDIQLYVSFDSKSEIDISAAKHKLIQCISEIRSWMVSNKLKLNDLKTELCFIPAYRHCNAVQTLELRIGEAVIAPSMSTKILGVMFDNQLNMKNHVSQLCKSINFHLRNLSRIHNFIDTSTCAHAVRSLILSRLDYCNSLLGGLPISDVRRLQILQNRAARLIFQVSRRTSAAPLVQELHWLPVQQRIEYKLLVHVYNCLHNSAPVYLSDLISKYCSGRRGLRSAQDIFRLTIPKTKRSFGDKSFSFLGPRLWNNLPSSIREASNVQSFKKYLKTHLFPNS